MRWMPLLLLLSCSSPPAVREPDLQAPPRGPAGLFEDCVPASQEVACAPGLRCALVRVGEAPYEGTLTQCVPAVATPLAEDAPCSFHEEAPQPAGAVRKRFDRCADGAGCVDTATGPRCRTLCPLRVQKTCGKGRLCVLPAPASGVGYCAAPDGCEAVPPQRGCPRGPDGQALGCYVLTEARTGEVAPPGGTFCLARAPLGDSTGELGSRCERSANCQPGLSCVAQAGERQATCRPYCALSPTDAGLPDGGLPCEADLGHCQPISGYERVGRCY